MNPLASPRAGASRVRTGSPTVAVVGLGYVGLPTALSLLEGGATVVGLDVSQARLQDIRAGEVDLLDTDRPRLAAALAHPALGLTADPAALEAADAVVVCVPTPVDHEHRPDLRALEGACATAVAHARPGQVIVLTSTSYVGCTRRLVAERLAARGLEPGVDVHVAFSPERIDPGVPGHQPELTPRVLGGLTEACGRRAADVLAPTAKQLHLVSSPEAAEACKLLENTFRAVNIAFANEFADAARTLGLDPQEVIDAAATKPYGFMPFRPGPGVGGHCIPCDPYYLTVPLAERGSAMPLTEEAMRQIARRPIDVAARALELAGGRPGARVLLAGIAYKPGVADVRESPALEILAHLEAAGAHVDFHDPLVPTFEQAGRVRMSVPPAAAGYDVAVLLVAHPGQDLGWLAQAPVVLDGTYRTTDLATRRELI